MDALPDDTLIQLATDALWPSDIAAMRATSPRQYAVLNDPLVARRLLTHHWRVHPRLRAVLSALFLGQPAPWATVRTLRVVQRDGDPTLYVALDHAICTSLDPLDPGARHFSVTGESELSWIALLQLLGLLTARLGGPGVEWDATTPRLTQAPEHTASWPWFFFCMEQALAEACAPAQGPYRIAGVARDLNTAIAALIREMTTWPAFRSKGQSLLQLLLFRAELENTVCPTMPPHMTGLVGAVATPIDWAYAQWLVDEGHTASIASLEDFEDTLGNDDVASAAIGTWILRGQWRSMGALLLASVPTDGQHPRESTRQSLQGLLFTLVIEPKEVLRILILSHDVGDATADGPDPEAVLEELLPALATAADDDERLGQLLRQAEDQLHPRGETVPAARRTRLELLWHVIAAELQKRH